MTRSRSLPFALAFIVPLLSGLAVSFGGWALLLPPAFLFVETILRWISSCLPVSVFLIRSAM